MLSILTAQATINTKVDISKSFLLSDYDLQDSMDDLDVIFKIVANAKSLLVFKLS